MNASKQSLVAVALAALAIGPALADHGGRRTVIGEPLPPGAVFVVPRPVRSTLPPPPVGYRYAVVNHQVVLVSRSNLVVDIIRNLIG